eukprot:TRINITY_DN14563_c0_g1_i1.p1 TRINITY_DN14563_c0_g1~~TRINITY_DN14563_c0_g1_i1.p1  ORF type:complete len:369 (-),score=55.20 TRINITY_DN14563_c0_g1_i1:93-1172(-)
MESQQIDEQIDALEALIRKAKHLVVYTGAGISTAAKLPDFRSDTGLLSGMGKGVLGIQEHKLDQIMPTYSHMALKTLVDHNIVKFIVTSNHDDIHYRSGVPSEKLAELFGNAYVEKCGTCRSQYHRKTQRPHLGRRNCDNTACGGRLAVTGVRFGQSVPEEPLRRAQEQSLQADVALVIGSSMTVSPFCDLPSASEDCKIIICSLSPTPADKYAVLNVRAHCDGMMQRLMQRLNLSIADYVFRQDFAIGHELKQGSIYRLFVGGAALNEQCTAADSVSVLLKPTGTSIELVQNNRCVFEADVDFAGLSHDVEFHITFKEEYAEPVQVLPYTLAGDSGKSQSSLQKVVAYTGDFTQPQQD